jgi:WhiB family transcriptional regulator, redox-sensing transcriptional regulator
VAELRRWQDRAACQDADPELFFYPDGERGLDREQRDDAHLNLPRVAHRICPLW